MSWFSRLKNALNSRRLDQDLDEETRDHIERRAADLQRSGLDRSEARRQAALLFGNPTSIRESCRELRLAAGLERTLKDLRYALRCLRRNPVFAITAIASLGLAIGANTAIYSIIDAALLRDLPLPNPGRLVTLATSGSNPQGNAVAADPETFSYADYEQLDAAAGVSARIALLGASNRVEARASGSDDSPYEEVVAQYVSPNAFQVLGAAPALGEFFSPREDHYPAPRAAVVLSYAYWQRRFGGDPAILGRTLLVDNGLFSVLGVAPKGFSGTEPGRFVDIWLPVTKMDPGVFTNEARLFRLMGRLESGVSREQLAARLQPAFQLRQKLRIGRGTLTPAMQKQLRAMRIVAYSGANGTGNFRRSFAQPLSILLGVAVLMLVIACANVASLLLARSIVRSGEMALRVSLGAGRGRLFRQLMTEGLVLSFLAGILGWLFASSAAPALVAMVSTTGSPVQLALALNGRVLFFCAALCAASALLFGSLPAWQATSSGPISELRHDSGQARRWRIGRLFVGIQIAFAFTLVVGGTALLLSFRKLADVGAGFDPRGVTVVSMVNSSQRDRQLALAQQLQMRVGQLAEVQGTATAWMPVFSGARRADRVVLPGKAPSQREETFYRVSRGYFAALRTPLLSGRDFTFRDNDDEPVPTIVNRAFARRYFGQESVIGREFRRDDGVRHQIVGLAADSHFISLRNGIEPIAYMPMKPPRAFTLYVRSTLDPPSVLKAVQREADALGSGLRAREIITLEALVGSTIRTERLLASIGAAFAILGLVLAAAGLFGLLNYSVTRRTREIGIRVALGARRQSICGLVLRDLFGTIAGGLVVGTAGALVLMRFVRSLLFEIGPADPLVVGTAIAVFLAAALVASGLPALRAAKLDPVVALRHE
jgi:predicted permease